MKTPQIWNAPAKAKDEIARMYLSDIGGAVNEFNAGGVLNPEQQLDTFVSLRAMSTFLAPAVNVVSAATASGFIPANANPNPMLPNAAPPGMGGVPISSGGPGITFIADNSGRETGDVEDFNISGYVIRGATEATADSGAARKIIKPKTERWSLEKMHIFDEWSREMTWRTLMGDQFSSFLMSNTMPVAVSNIEELAFLGDETISATDPRSEALKINDGWLKQMRARSVNLDAEGNYVDTGMFFDMVRSMPDLYRNQLKYWFSHPDVYTDWVQRMSGRGAGAAEASAAILGVAPAPCGIQFWTVPLLPTDEAVSSISTATSARVIGWAQDRFSFPTDAYQLTINVDGAGAEVVTFTHQNATSKPDRALSVFQVAKVINDALVAAYDDTSYRSVARVGQHGRLELVSPTAGAGSSIVLADGANSCLDVLGLVADTYNGQAAAAGNTAYFGTPVVLTFPSNFVWRVGTAMRPNHTTGFDQHIRYVQESDHIRYDAWAYMDFYMRKYEGAVVLNGVRTAKPGENMLGT